jgi:glutamate racemase
MKIGFFDSGIGGLTVLKEALKILPNAEYIYFSDGENAPYGTKTKAQVRDLVFAAIDFLVKKKVQIIVIACNTATSVCIDELRQTYQIPIIGMEPAVKPAVAYAADKRVLVFATELTLKLEKFKNLLAKVDTEHRVDYLPLQELVAYAERFEFKNPKIRTYLQEKFKNVDWQQYRAVVLGCTHFPFFKDLIAELIPADIKIFDGNLGTVNNMRKKCAEIGLEAAIKGKVQYYRSGKRKVKAGFERFLGEIN